MTLSIRNPEAEQLTRRLAAVTGESLIDEVILALRDRLQRIQAQRGQQRLSQRLMAIGAQCASLPTLDDRPEAEILGYGEDGLPP